MASDQFIIFLSWVCSIVPCTNGYQLYGICCCAYISFFIWYPWTNASLIVAESWCTECSCLQPKGDGLDITRDDLSKALMVCLLYLLFISKFVLSGFQFISYIRTSFICLAFVYDYHFTFYLLYSMLWKSSKGK